jgi:uncharacterized repeat protein (TIGR01451 family)
MDWQGNIALGYSVSSPTLYPSIRYATRLASDPPGILQNEASLQEGTGSQSGTNRWGDYSAMVVDPVDGCTFWYTNQYFLYTSTSWRTKIGAFQLPGCVPRGTADLSVSVHDAPDPVDAGQALTYTVTVGNRSAITATNVLLENELPGQTSVVEIDPAAACDEEGNRISCQLGTLPGESVWAVTVTVTVGDGTEPGPILYRSTVTADEADPDRRNNEAEATTLVAGYGVTLSPPQLGWAAPGDWLEYQVAITNTGNVTDTFDLSISGQVWTTTLTAGPATLSAGETAWFYVDVQVPTTVETGEMSAVTVAASSRADGAVAATTTITTAIPYPLYLPTVRK